MHSIKGCTRGDGPPMGHGHGWRMCGPTGSRATLGTFCRRKPVPGSAVAPPRPPLRDLPAGLGAPRHPPAPPATGHSLEPFPERPPGYQTPGQPGGTNRIKVKWEAPDGAPALASLWPAACGWLLPAKVLIQLGRNQGPTQTRGRGRGPLQAVAGLLSRPAQPCVLSWSPGEWIWG